MFASLEPSKQSIESYHGDLESSWLNRNLGKLLETWKQVFVLSSWSKQKSLIDLIEIDELVSSSSSHLRVEFIMKMIMENCEHKYMLES